MEKAQIKLSRRTPTFSPKSECNGCHQQRYASSKILRQQNFPVLNWRCRLMQVDLYDGCKMVIVMFVVIL